MYLYSTNHASSGVIQSYLGSCLTRYLLVSPPLHLCLIVAEVISLLALGQVWDTAEFLVVVHGPVFSPNAVHNIWMREETTVPSSVKPGQVYAAWISSIADADSVHNVTSTKQSLVIKLL